MTTEQLLRHDEHCRICGSRKITTVIQLADTPLEDQFLRKPLHQPVYPLHVALCEDCGYLHLPHVVDPAASYSEYLYASGVTVGLRSHYDEYAQNIVTQYAVPQGGLVVDLGSNDGSMLASFQRLGMRVLGVEPASTAARLANDQGLATINDFFTMDVAQKILCEHGRANVVTANYMYANVDDVLSFTRQVTEILAPGGIFVVQTGYHPEQMKKKMFDYIYHEHFSYFTVDVLDQIFSRCGLQLIDAQKNSPKGGSLRGIAQLAGGGRAVSANVAQIIEQERRSGMRTAGVYIDFMKEVDGAREELRQKLRELHNQGIKIIGFGASHSTTTLIYHFGLADYLEYIVDDNVLKHGTYSPGNHIPVHPTQKAYDDSPCAVLILAWQHQDSILHRHAELLRKGHAFLIPLPKFEHISDANGQPLQN